jgi:hypothetical protein
MGIKKITPTPMPNRYIIVSAVISCNNIANDRITLPIHTARLRVVCDDGGLAYYPQGHLGLLPECDH